jgi:hypothetical protein
MGMLTPTPLSRRRLEAFGMNDVYRALYERDNVLLFSDPEGNRLLGAYLAEHYGVRLGGKIAFTDPALSPSAFYAFTDLRRGTAQPGGNPLP